MYPQRGTVVGGYRLSHRLGRGGFGEVWEAALVDDRGKTTRRLGTTGLVKPARIAVKLIVDRKSAELEKRGAAIVQAIQHRHVLRVYDYYDEEHYLVIEMELASKSLQQFHAEHAKKGGRIAHGELLDYIEQAAAGIDHLCDVGGSRHIIHGDVKPQNLLLVAEEGAARHILKLSDYSLLKETTNTTTVADQGTPAFMAPEVYRGKMNVRGSDQYSLAGTYYFLRTGFVPFPKPILPAVDPRADTTTVIEMPREEQEVIARAMAVEPAARFASCKAFVRALKQAVARTEKTNPFQPKGVHTMPKPSFPQIPWDHRVARWAVACCGALLILFIGFLLYASADPPPTAPQKMQSAARDESAKNDTRIGTLEAEVQQLRDAVRAAKGEVRPDAGEVKARLEQLAENMKSVQNAVHTLEAQFGHINRTTVSRDEVRDEMKPVAATVTAVQREVHALAERIDALATKKDQAAAVAELAIVRAAADDLRARLIAVEAGLANLAKTKVDADELDGTWDLATVETRYDKDHTDTKRVQGVLSFTFRNGGWFRMERHLKAKDNGAAPENDAAGTYTIKNNKPAREIDIVRWIPGDANVPARQQWSRAIYDRTGEDKLTIAIGLSDGDFIATFCDKADQRPATMDDHVILLHFTRRAK